MKIPKEFCLIIKKEDPLLKVLKVGKTEIGFSYSTGERETNRLRYFILRDMRETSWYWRHKNEFFCFFKLKDP